MGITIIPRVIVWFLVVMAKTMYRLVIPYRFQKKKSLKGKKVILTGACGGLGSAFARALAKEGCHLALWDINELGLKKLKMDLLDQHDIDVFTQVVDIANEQEVIQKSNELKSLFGEINMVFNNAGVINVTPLLETSTELLEKLIHVNLMSHYYIIKQFLPTMIERNEGHIVATCSAAGHICPSEVVDYTGSKFAVRGYMEALYHQMLAAGHNIEFTTICPWYVKSPMFKQEEHPNMAFNACDCEEMVERSIKAIRLNEKEIIFPAHINIFPILRGIFPICVGRSVLLRKLCYS